MGKKRRVKKPVGKKAQKEKPPVAMQLSMFGPPRMKMPVDKKSPMEILLEKLHSKGNGPVFFKTSKVGRKTINVTADVRKMLESLAMIPGADVKELVELMIKGVEHNLFEGRTREEIFEMLRKGVSVEGAELIPIKPVARDEHENTGIDVSLNRLAFWLWKTEDVRAKRKQHSRRR